MSINSLNGYVDIDKDAVENFHGNQLVYIDWDNHRLYCSALAFPLPPEMPFGALTAEVIPSAWGPHPLFSKLDWSEVTWILDNEPFTPNLEASLAENGVTHKSLLRFASPKLDATGKNGV